MARTYKRDSRGRFAGGGGSSSGGKRGGSSKASSGGGRKRNKSFVTTTGTFLTRGRAKVAQTARTKAFSSKATMGRSAKEAWKKASGEKRKAGRPSAGAAVKKAKTRTRISTNKQVIAKPKGLRPGAVAESMAQRALAIIKKADKGESRARSNASRLRGQLSNANYSLTSNPYSKQKRAANKERKSRQRRVDRLQQRLDRQYGAQAVYASRRDQAFNRYKEVRASQQRASAIPSGRRSRALQRNIFGGLDISYS